MIKTFRHKGLEQLHRTGKGKLVDASLRARLAAQLQVLDAASNERDMDLPGYKLHELKPRWPGLWAVTVRANWRLTFRFRGGDAYDVDLVDYH
jgi:toxin HigB-1